MPLNFFKSFTSSDSSASGSEAGWLDTIKETRITIEGNDGEFDRLRGSSGFSGIEDFALPADVWQARNNIHYDADSSSSSCAIDDSSSASDPVSAFRPLHTRLPCILGERSFRIEGTDGELDRLCRSLRFTGIADFAIPAAAWEAKGNDPTQNHFLEWSQFYLGGKGSERGGNGIKEARPPGLKPPPSMRHPPIDPSCSTWDLFKGLGPIEKDPGDVAHGGFSSCDEAEGGVNGMDFKDDKGVRLGETVVLSTSCSFTTSNDDDSLSSTIRPLSNTSPNDRIRWNITSWEKGDLLGHRTLGSVYEGISYGIFFAVKELSLLDQGTMGRQGILQLEQEIDLLSQFRHENIVRYYGTTKDDSKLYIFLELVTKGSLSNLYQRYKLRDSQVSAYTRQILHGLKYLHNRNVIHRDIKCANLLADTNGSVKLADYGLATNLNDVKSCKGTAFWMAPEVVKAKNHGYGLPADIWSLGCTVLEMLTGQFPYAPSDWMQALFRIGKGEPPPAPETLSKDARDFILKCVQVNPDDRLTAAQLSNHPFVRPMRGTLGSTSPYQLGRRLST